MSEPWNGIKRDGCGWPVDLPQAEKDWLVDAARHVLRRWGKPLELYIIHGQITQMARTGWVHAALSTTGEAMTACPAPVFSSWRLLDATYCAVERALRAADAGPVYWLAPEVQAEPEPEMATRKPTTRKPRKTREPAAACKCAACGRAYLSEAPATGLRLCACGAVVTADGSILEGHSTNTMGGTRKKVGT